MRRSVWMVMACGLALAAPVGASAKEGSRFQEAVRSDGGVVASASRLASRAGIAVLDEGGNAVDAAVTTVFAIGVTQPEMCGVGGGGFLVYRGADGREAALDFREKAPSSYTFSAGVGADPALAFGTGHNVIGVPGTVAGMDAALRRFGTIAWTRAVTPAETIARGGFTVNEELSYWMKEHQLRMALYPEMALTFLKAGAVPYEPGETLQLPAYADSLRAIATGGAKAFYEGAIAKAIVRDMQTSGAYPGDRGTMTAADLKAYRAVWRAPLTGRYHGHRIVAMPPPTSGGLLAIEILNLLEGFNLRAAGDSSADHLHLLAEAQKLAWADRNAYVGDPDFVDVPVATMTSKHYAAGRRAEISLDRAGTYAPGAGPVPAAAGTAGDRGGHTTHVSVIDRAGNAVAVTCTIEQPFGSAVVARGTGFPLNNQLTDFDGPGTANEPAPNKRPRSSTSPTIVVRRGRPELVLGGAGGSMIPMGVIGAIERVADFGRDLARAVDAERVDSRGSWCNTGPRSLCVEEARFAPGVADELRRRGHELIFGGEYAVAPIINAAGTDLRTGEHLATSDPRVPPESDGRGAMGQGG